MSWIITLSGNKSRIKNIGRMPFMTPLKTLFRAATQRHSVQSNVQSVLPYELGII
jgi:hypothetical protein